MRKYIQCSLNCIRKTLICLALISIGYLLGNAFPTFEVVPYGYVAKKETQQNDPLGLNVDVCKHKCKDFIDNVGG